MAYSLFNRVIMKYFCVGSYRLCASLATHMISEIILRHDSISSIVKYIGEDKNQCNPYPKTPFSGRYLT